MKLTQGILPASKVQDGPDNEVASNPDKYGGFDLGTWSMTPWGKSTTGIVKEYNIRQIEECSFGVQCVHKFTKEECKKVVDYLQTWAKTKYRGKKGYLSPDNHFGWYKEYYDIFIKIFQNYEDLPVYYWSN